MNILSSLSLLEFHVSSQFPVCRKLYIAWEKLDIWTLCKKVHHIQESFHFYLYPLELLSLLLAVLKRYVVRSLWECLRTSGTHLLVEFLSLMVAIVFFSQCFFNLNVMFSVLLGCYHNRFIYRSWHSFLSNTAACSDLCFILLWASAFWFITRLKSSPTMIVPFATVISKEGILYRRCAPFSGGLYTLIKVMSCPSNSQVTNTYLHSSSLIHFSLLNIRLFLIGTATPLISDAWEEENTWVKANFSSFACSTLLKCVSWIISPPSFLSFWSVRFLFIVLFRLFVLREMNLNFELCLVMTQGQ